MSTLRRILPFSLLPALALAQAPAATTADPLPREIAEAIRAEGIERSQVMRILRDLTGKVGHRLTGSDNFTKGCEWARAEFAAMGLTNAHLEKWGEWKLVWNRGAWIGRITSPVLLDMYVATDAWTAGTKGLVPAKFVMAPASTDAVKPEDFKGKWVVTKRLWRANPKKPGMKEALLEAGVAGFVYRATDPDKNFPTRVRVFGDDKTAMKPLEDAPTIPEIAVRADHFDTLFELVESGKDPVGEFDIQNTFRDGPIALHNVIAEIPGTTKPDEVVIVSAHLDSWHQVQGTTDNGTGTSTTLEAARILAAVGAMPQRTIRFCLWGGEEQGLLGSQKYVQKHRTEMPKVSAVFNHDTGTNWAQSLAVTEAMKAQLDPIFQRVNELLTAPDKDWSGPLFNLRVVGAVRGGGGSDHASFLAAGVPGLDWGLKGRSNYFAHTWHTQWDTIDVAIEEYQRHTATIVAMAALGTANLDKPLDRQNVGGAGGGAGQSAALMAGVFEAEFDGLTVTSVKEGGRGATMGLQKGDVLKEVAGNEVERARQVFQFARDAEGDTVALKFQRGEKTFDASLKKADLPKPPERPAAPPADGSAPGGTSSGLPSSAPKPPSQPPPPPPVQNPPPQD